MIEPFADVVEANRSYAEDFHLKGLAGHAGRELAVVTCIDSRIEPLEMLGLKPGDSKILRNAGARITNDAHRSLVLATNLLDVRRIMVVAHTDCAMSGKSDAELHEAISEASDGRVDATGLVLHSAQDQHETLRADVERLRRSTQLAPGVTVAAFIYDVDTGLIHHVAT
ncbi:MAG: carbonic anhydrase [Gaiellales bacterium]